MSDIKTGGPAFPIGDTHLIAECGMTLRDYFAAKAMQGAIAARADFLSRIDAAKAAYLMADAMLEER